MAVRDGERFVGDAIGSLRSQTLGEFELVVVDDGSTDATPGIVAALAADDDRIHLHVREHAGYSEALNAGWQQDLMPPKNSVAGIAPPPMSFSLE
jgi:glycosyltransferase involved in cell wall biosynthesis